MDSKFWKTTIVTQEYYTKQNYILKAKIKMLHYNSLKEFMITNSALQRILGAAFDSEEDKHIQGRTKKQQKVLEEV